MQLLQLAGPSASGWLFSAVNLGLPSYAGTQVLSNYLFGIVQPVFQEPE